MLPSEQFRPNRTLHLFLLINWPVLFSYVLKMFFTSRACSSLAWTKRRLVV
jgi:hypothetical protein